jgi:hypothetical protein
VRIESCRYGLANMDDLVAHEAPVRGVTEELAREYLTRHIVFELGDRDYAGLDLYLKLALAVGVSA